MKNEDLVPWRVTLRRFVPWVLLQVLLRVCFVIVWAGYGRIVAQEFKRTAL